MRKTTVYEIKTKHNLIGGHKRYARGQAQKNTIRQISLGIPTHLMQFMRQRWLSEICSYIIHKLSVSNVRERSDHVESLSLNQTHKHMTDDLMKHHTSAKGDHTMTPDAHHRHVLLYDQASQDITHMHIYTRWWMGDACLFTAQTNVFPKPRDRCPSAHRAHFISSHSFAWCILSPRCSRTRFHCCQPYVTQKPTTPIH